MAQLRHEYEQFRATNTEVLVMAPNKPASLARYLNAHPTPFPILSDPARASPSRYGIEAIHAPFLTFFVGAMFVVDRAGRIRFADYSVPLVSRPDDNQALAVQLRCRSPAGSFSAGPAGPRHPASGAAPPKPPMTVWAARLTPSSPEVAASAGNAKSA